MWGGHSGESDLLYNTRVLEVCFKRVSIVSYFQHDSAHFCATVSKWRRCRFSSSVTADCIGDHYVSSVFPREQGATPSISTGFVPDSGPFELTHYLISLGCRSVDSPTAHLGTISGSHRSHGRSVHRRDAHGDQRGLRRRRAVDRGGLDLGVLDAGWVCTARSRIYSRQEYREHSDEELHGLLRGVTRLLVDCVWTHVRQVQRILWHHWVHVVGLRIQHLDVHLLVISNGICRYFCHHRLGSAG